MNRREIQPPYSQIGPSLPYALRLARCQSLNLREPIEALPTEQNVVNKEITRDEERIMTLNASVVLALEDLFSWRSVTRTYQYII